MFTIGKNFGQLAPEVVVIMPHFREACDKAPHQLRITLICSLNRGCRCKAPPCKIFKELHREVPHHVR